MSIQKVSALTAQRPGKCWLHVNYNFFVKSNKDPHSFCAQGDCNFFFHFRNHRRSQSTLSWEPGAQALEERFLSDQQTRTRDQALVRAFPFMEPLSLGHIWSPSISSYSAALCAVPRFAKATNNVLGHITWDLATELLPLSEQPRSWKIPKAQVIYLNMCLLHFLWPLTFRMQRIWV